MTETRLAAVAIGCLLLACTVADAQTLDWDQDDSIHLSEAVSAGTYGGVTSVLIEQDGNIVYEAYFQGTDANTHHNTRSAGKTFTGLLLGAAIDDGFIKGVDTEVADYFSELRPFSNDDERKSDISLEDLLTMSGPLECDDWNSFSRGNEERMYLVEDWSAFFWNLPIKNRPSWEIPDSDDGFGRLFTYCTAGVQLIGETIERAIGVSVPEYASRRIFGPLDIQNPLWNFASTGKAHLGGGLELSTRDWAKVARVYLNQGSSDQSNVISDSWVSASLSDYVRVDDTTTYGYLWWRPEYSIDGKTLRANMMSGAGGNRVYVLPEYQIVVVLTKNDFRDRDAHQKSDNFFAEQIVRRLSAAADPKSIE